MYVITTEQGLNTHLPDKRLTIFRNERMTPYTSLASSSKGSPAPAEVTADDDDGGGGGGVPGDDEDVMVWPAASLNATRMPEVDVRVLRGLEKGVGTGVPGAEPGAEEDEVGGGGRGERACETPGRSAPPSLARFGRLVRCCQSW